MATRFLLFSALVALATAGRLYVKEAGVDGKTGIDLVDGFKFCPAKFSSKGFSIVCTPTEPGTTAHVRFYVNDVIGRRESVAPYTINGDSNGNFIAWEPTGDLTSQKIACVVYTADGWKENIIATGSFACDGAEPALPSQSAQPTQPAVALAPSSTPSAAPSKADGVYLRVIEANSQNPRKSDPLADNFRFCPTEFNDMISIECVAPESATYAELYVNDQLQRRESVKPFTIAGDSGGNSNRWSVVAGRVALRCETNAGSASVYGYFECDTASAVAGPAPSQSSAATKTPAPATGKTSPVGVNSKYCVLIPATTYTNEKGDDWVLQPDGKSLTFRPNDTFGGALPPSTSKLFYTFEVPVESHYAITMASRTIHNTEHNDIWITFGDGVTLIRLENGKISSRMDNLKGPLKSYHGQPNRYSKVALSVDHTEHTFSTTNKLKPGIKYRIVVGARSTQFQLYGLIMFPCYEEQCWIWGDWFQKNYLPICHLP